MNEQSFAQQVEKAYSALRQLVLENRDKFNSDFVEAIQHEKYNLPNSVPAFVNDINTIYFILIATHCDWETICNYPVKDRNETIGEFCSIVASSCSSFFSWTDEEFNALRREIIYGDKHFSDYMADMKEFQSHYDKTGSYGSLVHIYDLSVMFGRKKEARNYLSLIRDCREKEQLAEIDYLIFSAGFFNKFGIEYQDLTYLLEVLNDFQNYEIPNRLSAQYDPVVYLRVWVELLFDYLYALQDSRLQNEPTPKSFNEIVLKIIEHDDSVLLQLDPEFILSASDDELDLIKKHDDLLLELIQYCPGEIQSPIFRGTEILLWYKQLNMAFPNKLDCLLSSRPSKARCRHPYNMTDSDMISRLVLEFPDQEKDIREAISMCEDTDDDLDLDLDLDEDI